MYLNTDFYSVFIFNFAGEDVPVYALGPLATTLFTGTFDQSYIPHAIAYSACIGEHRLRCHGNDNNTALQNSIASVGLGSASCSPAENGGASGSVPVVIASSVMADDGTRSKSRAGRGRHVYDSTVRAALTIAAILASVT